MKKYLAGAAIIAMTASGLAIAGGMKGGHMAMLDTNDDGQITKAEAQAGSTQMFTKMDANKDGKLDKSDREAAMAARFAGTDTNNDGELSKAEMAAEHDRKMADRQTRRAERNPDRPAATAEKKAEWEAKRAERMDAKFTAMDTDNSGGLSQTELAAGKDMMRGEKGKRGGKHEGRMMKRADTDGDGAISQAEFEASSTARFAKADTNSDGVISAEEMKAMRGKRGHHGDRDGKRRHGPEGQAPADEG